MSDLPRFAVVGHPNKGKSSIVATLAEDDTVAIAKESGTTTRARSFPMRIDEAPLYELIDTPGFQRARAVLAWLTAHERGAEARPAVLRAFVDSHRDDPSFQSECELLQAVIDGAGILYVVDGAKPYSREYEAEMEILRWSGQPRMALINLIGRGDHVDEWRRALDQFFAIVRVFDAVHADFDKRIELLRAFGELHEPWASKLKEAADALIRERKRRRERSATEIADLLCHCLTISCRAGFEGDAPDEALKSRLTNELMQAVRNRERKARKLVQEIYQHGGVVLEEANASLLSTDVFSEQSFNLFGLSGMQLALTGAASGAIAIGGVDLLFGGASLGLATALGALVGGAGTLFAADRLAKVKVLGTPLGGSELRIGPITNPNFPWVLLGRALLHHRLVAERNHALRERLVVDAARGEHFTDTLDLEHRRTLDRCFKTLRDERAADTEIRTALVNEIVSLMDSETASP